MIIALHFYILALILLEFMTSYLILYYNTTFILLVTNIDKSLLKGIDSIDIQDSILVVHIQLRNELPYDIDQTLCVERHLLSD